MNNQTRTRTNPAQPKRPSYKIAEYSIQWSNVQEHEEEWIPHCVPLLKSIWYYVHLVFFRYYWFSSGRGENEKEVSAHFNNGIFVHILPFGWQFSSFLCIRQSENLLFGIWVWSNSNLVRHKFGIWSFGNAPFIAQNSVTDWLIDSFIHSFDWL